MFYAGKKFAKNFPDEKSELLCTLFNYSEPVTVINKLASMHMAANLAVLGVFEKDGVVRGRHVYKIYCTPSCDWRGANFNDRRQQ